MRKGSESTFKMPYRSYRSSAGIVVALSLGMLSSGLQGCSAPRNPASDQINQAVKQIQDENADGQDGEETRRRSLLAKLGWDKLPDEGRSDSLPDDLTDTVFYGEDGTEIKCTSPDAVEVKRSSDDEAVVGVYEVNSSGESSILYFKFPDDEESVEANFMVMRNGRKVTLSLQGAGDSGLPSVIRGTLPE